MSERIVLKNVRLSFPSLFHKASFDGNEGKYEATFLISKEDEATYKKLKAVIDAKMKEAKIKVPSDRICLKDGDEVDYDGYAGTWSLKASTKKRPQLFDRDKTPIAEEDEKLYAGCYVNASIDFWVQNNNYGKRVNSNLFAVQFFKDGEAFGTGAVDASDDFDDLGDDFEDDFDL